MSKEKQCKCCHEWWYDSDVKENLCPNCYDYFNQLKQQLAESFTEEDVEGLIEDRNKTIKFLQQQLAEKDIRIEELEGQFAYECECNMQLVDLQKQLEEKQNTIDEINKEFVQVVHDWKTLCAEKDKEIEIISSSKKHFKTCAENMSDILKTINSVLPKPQKNELNYKKVADDVVTLIKEKDKEIERLKQELEETNAGYDFTYEQSGATIKELQQNQTQLAIQELEKTKDLLLNESKNNPIIYDVNDDLVGGAIDKDAVFKIINQQIKELKGEKDE